MSFAMKNVKLGILCDLTTSKEEFHKLGDVFLKNLTAYFSHDAILTYFSPIFLPSKVVFLGLLVFSYKESRWLYLLSGLHQFLQPFRQAPI